MTSVSPLRVLIAGGGVAGVEAALALRAFAGARVAVTLVAPGRDLVRRPDSVTAPFAGGGVGRVPLERLRGVAVRPDTIVAIDTERRTARTADGARLDYDRLLVAVGARAVEAIPGAVPFHGVRSAGRIEGLLRRSGGPLTFVVPPGVTWPLPAYELALQAAAVAPPGGVRLVTPEPRPLDLFGAHVSDAVARLLDAAEVEVETGLHAETVLAGHLVGFGGSFLATGPVVSLPWLEGPRPAGLPHDDAGFLPIDGHGRVVAAPDVFAAGDATDGPVKQGGLATQQADAAAAAIAAEAGAPVEPARATHVLRAELVTAGQPLWLRSRPGDPGEVSRHPLWTPPGKVAGRFLSGFLATGAAADELVDLRIVHAPA